MHARLSFIISSSLVYFFPWSGKCFGFREREFPATIQPPEREREREREREERRGEKEREESERREELSYNTTAATNVHLESYHCSCDCVAVVPLFGEAEKGMV